MRRYLGGQGLTKRQKRAVRRWLDRNWEEVLRGRLIGYGNVILSHRDISSPEAEAALHSVFDTVDHDLYQRLNSELLNNFRCIKRPPGIAGSASMGERGKTTTTKMGTRAERKAYWKKTAATSSLPPKDKTKPMKIPSPNGDIMSRRLTTKLAEEIGNLVPPSGGKPGAGAGGDAGTHRFDSVEHVLSIMGRKHPQSAEQLRKLLKAGDIERGSIPKLYSAGSLAQRLFVSISSDPEFKRRFGSRGLRSLANAVAFIGPKGKRIPKVKRVLGPDGDGIFNFLKARGYIEIHTKNSVAYLARAL